METSVLSETLVFRSEEQRLKTDCIVAFRLLDPNAFAPAVCLMLDLVAPTVQMCFQSLVGAFHRLVIDE